MARIMIVEDRPDDAVPLQRALASTGHEIAIYTDGREALAEILRQTPDILVLDLMLPEMDGPSLLEVIRSYLRIQNLPVVVLTALSEGPLIERVRNMKVNAIVLKGKASLEEVRDTVLHSLGHLPTA